VCNSGSKREKGGRENIGIIFEEGETLKYRSAGRIFEVKKRTGQFVLSQSLDRLTQVLTGEKNIFNFFEKILHLTSGKTYKKEVMALTACRLEDYKKGGWRTNLSSFNVSELYKKEDL
jgi:ABC-type phosphate/phosphonate transport system ATPase subunit